MNPRTAALGIWRAALDAGAPGPLVARALERRRLPAAPGSIRLVAIGKAGAALAASAEEALGERIGRGLVIVKDGHGTALSRVALLEAAHPIPDGRSEAAAHRLLAEVAGCAREEVLLVLLSGGASALVAAPAAGVTLADKQGVTRLLLEAGAPIEELNAVRKHLSAVKGGLLARAAAPTPILTLALSDVIGDRPDVIASGPTAPDPTTFRDALDVLVSRRIVSDVPPGVVRRLAAGARGELEETPKAADPAFSRAEYGIIGNSSLVVAAAAEAARRAGFRPVILPRPLAGEARAEAARFVAAGRELAPPACLLAGGETTVTVRGRGRGGRCQEFALAAALELEDGDGAAVVLAAGTDGTDGPTDAAGGIVDGRIVAIGSAVGRGAAASLDENDAYGFLEATGGLVRTGPTLTNLLDLYLYMRAVPVA